MPRARNRFRSDQHEEQPEAEDDSGESSTSEMGLRRPQTESENNLKLLLESQNRTFSELIRAVQRAPNDAVTVVFPNFNPDRASTDAVSWSATVDYILSENSLEGSALVMALSRSLQGSASHWLAQTVYPGITWTQFRELFLQYFAGTENLAATVLNLLNGRPTEGESMSLYGSRVVTSLMSRWKSLTVEQIAFSVALAHVAGLDKRLRRHKSILETSCNRS